MKARHAAQQGLASHLPRTASSHAAIVATSASDLCDHVPGPALLIDRPLRNHAGMTLLDRAAVQFGGVTFATLVDATPSDGGLTIFEVTLAPRALIGPLHTHHREHAFTLLLEGAVTVQVGDEVVPVPSGRAVWMPKGTPHTFWNPSDAPARSLEIATPAGIEGYYADLAAALASADDVGAALVELSERYGIEFDWDSLDRLLVRHGLVLSGDDAASLDGA